ncbi:O-antigen translocase [Neobacillus sp. CF12]|uniref:O-antigen translocase n=1 Tax=Neobacillus sp. CF12 TaxID=3055864 RepID=UPI0025A105C7|nr:O-antigen translocase [Neobacillus sp. CF12]MDM5330257.1 O-antigen translocase [Neobacillus sp. CF12]
MNLLKTSFLSSIATVIKILTGFIVNKVLAIYVGPAGIAQIGQLQNFFSIVSNLSNFSISQGVTKYVSFYGEEEDKQIKYINAAITISFIASLITGLLIIVLHRYLSIILLKSDQYADIFIYIGIFLIFYAINSILLAAVNGFKKIRKFTLINVTQSFFGLALSILLTVKWGLSGAMYAYVFSQTLVLLISIGFLLKEDWVKKIRLRKVDRSIMKSYSNYTIMSMIHILTVPVSFIIIRNYITDTLSMEHAGYWQGLTKISDTYLMFITMSLSVYYLPRLSEIKDDLKLKKEIFDGYKLIIPILIVILLGVYFMKDFAILILYSEEFLVMKELFLFQLIGDFFKIASWLISFNMLVKEMTKHVIITELFYSITLTVLSIVFIKMFGLIGVTYAYSITYFLYFLMVAYMMRHILFLKAN